MIPIAAAVGRHIVNYLTAPLKGFVPLATGTPSLLEKCLRPGDVVLVEGDARISSVVKYLTQSTWSHSVLYVGSLPGQAEPDGEAHVMIEADPLLGVITIPLSKYAGAHTRICRPIGLGRAGCRLVVDNALAQVGHTYDIRHVFDLMRYMVSLPAPRQFRRRMLSFGSGEPTRAICSTMIAKAFLAASYPILPSPISIARIARLTGRKADAEAEIRELIHIRRHDLYVPRDFDISPYFAIVKPMIEDGFDYHEVSWAEEPADGD